MSNADTPRPRRTTASLAPLTGAALLAIVCLPDPLAVAAQASPGAVPPAAEPNEPVPPGQHLFHIAAGDLPSALESYAHTTGLKVRSALAPEKLAGFETKGVDGVFADDQALRIVLDDTGLTARSTASGVVEIAIRDSQQVEVSASLTAVGLQQFTEPLLDTAQTVGVVPQFIMSEQADTTLRDSLRNEPGISIAAGEGGSQGDSLTIRGFNARNDIFLDGIRDFGSYYRDTFDYEAVDVLEGPAGVEFGRGSTGGVVNQETKVPGEKPYVGGNVQTGTDAMRRLALDIDEPLTKVSDSLTNAAFRLNLVGEEAGIAEREYANTRRWGAAPSLAFGLNSSTRYYLTYLHEGENDQPDYGLPYFGAGVLPVDRSNYYGLLQGNWFRTDPDIVTGRAEHDFGLHLTLRNALRWANYPRNVAITEPQVNTTPTFGLVNGVPVATCSPTAATPCYNLHTPVSQILVKRNTIEVNSVEDILWDQASAIGHVSVGHIGNDYSIIVEGGRERSRPQRPVFSAYSYAPALTPDAHDAPVLPTGENVRAYVNSTSYGVGLNDTLKLTDRLQLSGGIRFDYFNTDYQSAPTHLSRLDKVPTYRAAAVYKPRLNGSIYFDTGTSFDPSAESLSLSANNAVEAPQFNRTYEVGTKWSFDRDRLNLNTSWFQTTKTNVYETDPNNTLNVIPVGDQRVRGAQVGALGHLPEHFDVILGYAYLSGVTTDTIANYSPFAAYYKQGDPVYGQAPFYISALGNPFANVPKNTANLWVTHALLWRFNGGFGFNQVSARRASSTGPIALPETSVPTPVTDVPLAFKVIPGYWTFNMMVEHPLTERISFQANVQNLTNNFFIDQPHPNHLIPGEGVNAQFGFLGRW